MTEKAEDALEEIYEALEIAKPYNLEIEVMYSSMKYLKEHKNASIREATDAGVNEWIK